MQRFNAVTYRIGIVGSGFGALVHVPAFQAHPQFELVAIASPRNARAIAEQRKIPFAFDSLEAMLAGTELDAVSISSPPYHHHDAVLTALAHKKHILCEKPFARTLSQAKAMAAAARNAGVACGIAHEFRFVPARLALYELVRNGHLGPLRQIESTSYRTMLRPESERPRSWWFNHDAGGGMAQAFGSHAIDAANWIAGRAPQTVRGFLRTAVPQRHDAQGPFTSEVDDGVFAVLDYGDGLAARITIDATVAISSETFAVHGGTLTAVASGATVTDPAVFTTDENETSELGIAPSPYAAYGAAHPSIPAFLSLLDAFARAIEGDPRDLPSFEDGLATQRVLDALGYRL